MLLIGVIGALVDRERQRVLMLLWAVGYWVYLEFVGPLHGLDSAYRYAEPIIPPLLLLAAAGVLTIGRRLNAERRVAIATVVALVLWAPIAHEAASRYRDNARWVSLRRATGVLEEVRRDESGVPVAQRASEHVYAGDEWILLALNANSRFAFDRDTLEGPEAQVNHDARLFLLGERPMVKGESALLVSATKPPEGASAEVLAAYPYPRATLTVYRLRGR